jgi:hypothetical protein
MYQQIKELAVNALDVQNKDLMDAALRQIVALCEANAPLKSKDLDGAPIEEVANRMQHLKDAGIPVSFTPKISTVKASAKGGKK